MKRWELLSVYCCGSRWWLHFRTLSRRLTLHRPEARFTGREMTSLTLHRSGLSTGIALRPRDFRATFALPISGELGLDAGKGGGSCRNRLLLRCIWIQRLQDERRRPLNGRSRLGATKTRACVARRSGEHRMDEIELMTLKSKGKMLVPTQQSQLKRR
jgi:hypothetical protein